MNITTKVKISKSYLLFFFCFIFICKLVLLICRSESCSPEPRRHPPTTSSSSRSSKHRRHQSVCVSSTFEPRVISGAFLPSNLVTSGDFVPSNSSMDPLTDDLRAAVDNLSLGRVPSSSASDPDLAHDYAEIYTPSREKVPWPRAPTPPLHRFPSWEDRIYQVLKVISAKKLMLLNKLIIGCCGWSNVNRYNS